MDGMLSQEEINALLSGISADSNQGDTTEQTDTSALLTEEEKDAIGEISNISLGTAATTLFSLVNQKVVITTPKVSYATWEDLTNSYSRPCVFIQIFYKEGLEGNNILILKESDVKIIADLMMGGDGSNVADELTELHLSAISEAMNQMMGSSSTSLSSILDKKVDISPPSAMVVDMHDDISGGDIAGFLKDTFVKVSFKMEIGNLVDSELMQLYPIDFARDLYRKFTQSNQESQMAQAPKVETKIAGGQATTGTTPFVEQQMPENMTPNNMGMPNPMGMQGNMMGMNGAYANPMNMQAGVGMQNQMQSGYPQYNVPPMQEVNVQPAQFQPFASAISPAMQQENIDLLLDVPLEVTVELGRTNKSIKEILDFTPGTIIELNRLAGEPIDVLVNGKYVAKGEVVVIEEAFGIRVTEIIK